MSHVEAVYQKGVFRPLGQVELAENQRVRLHVEPMPASSMEGWLKEARNLQKQFTDRGITLAGSEDDISEDRIRSVTQS